MTVTDITQTRSAEKPIVMSGAAVTDILKHADSMQVWNSASLWTPVCMTTRRLTKTDP